MRHQSHYKIIAANTFDVIIGDIYGCTRHQSSQNRKKSPKNVKKETLCGRKEVCRIRYVTTV